MRALLSFQLPLTITLPCLGAAPRRLPRMYLSFFHSGFTGWAFVDKALAIEHHYLLMDPDTTSLN